MPVLIETGQVVLKKVKNQDSQSLQRDRQTPDDKRSDKLTYLSFSSDELKFIGCCINNIKKVAHMTEIRQERWHIGLTKAEKL